MYPLDFRYGEREDYRRYVATTPVLLPFMKPFYLTNEPKPLHVPSEDSSSAAEGTSALVEVPGARASHKC